MHINYKNAYGKKLRYKGILNSVTNYCARKNIGDIPTECNNIHYIRTIWNKKSAICVLNKSINEYTFA